MHHGNKALQAFIERTVICPYCGHAISFNNSNCPHCSEPVHIPDDDHQNVEFESINDGYHSWNSQPTAYHIIYRCSSYPACCPACRHNGDTFCYSGKINIRIARKEQSGRISYRWDHGTKKYDDDEVIIH